MGDIWRGVQFGRYRTKPPDHYSDMSRAQSRTPHLRPTVAGDIFSPSPGDHSLLEGGNDDFLTPRSSTRWLPVSREPDPRYDAKADKDGYFHCPFAVEGCNHKITKQKCIYDKNLDSHLKPYRCRYGVTDESCRGLRFSSNAIVFRHDREVHRLQNPELNPYLCKFQGCERARRDNGFPRRWNQRDHMKRVHGYEEVDNEESADRGYMDPSVLRMGSSNSDDKFHNRSSAEEVRVPNISMEFIDKNNGYSKVFERVREGVPEADEQNKEEGGKTYQQAAREEMVRVNRAVESPQNRREERALPKIQREKWAFERRSDTHHDDYIGIGTRDKSDNDYNSHNYQEDSLSPRDSIPFHSEKGPTIRSFKLERGADSRAYSKAVISAGNGVVEEIKLHAVKPGTDTDITIPRHGSSDSTEIEARSIPDRSSPGFRRVLEAGSLDKIDEIFGKMTVGEPEPIVEKLEDGILSLREDIIDATNEKREKRLGDVKGKGFKRSLNLDLIGDSTKHVLPERHQRHLMPLTDSGYDSHKPTNNIHPDHKIQEVMDRPRSIKPTYAATSYSDNASLETTKRGTFIERLAEQLVTDLVIKSANARDALDLCDEMVEILAEFALKLGHGTSAIGPQQAMVFIYKYRRNIVSCFRSMILRQVDESDHEDDEARSKSDEMPLSDKMRMYRDSMIAEPVEELTPYASDDNLAGEVSCETEFDQESVPSDNIQDVDKYLLYVCKTPHYQWLLATSRCKISLTSSKPVLSDVRQDILSALPKATNMQKTGCRRLQAVFNMRWVPRQVLEQRWRSFDSASSGNRPHLIPEGEANENVSSISSFTLGDILTITGESSEAQALSCSAYLAQTWPMTGDFILHLIEEVVVHGNKGERSIQRTDGTVITMSQEDEKSLKVQVSGTKGAIVEAGEQLAWLGAALRCSPSEQGVVYCIAGVSNAANASKSNVDDAGSIDGTGSADTQPPDRRPELPHGAENAFSFDIDFRFETAPMPAVSSGTCWQHLFQSPVIAKGFPILKRIQPSLGLEMPLNVMAGLLGTTCVNTFGGGVYLKGHSAILCPTQTLENVVVWHLDFSSRKNYMPYPPKGQAEHPEVRLDQLARLRHIVGWCRVAENRTGMADGIYKTRRCRLSKTNAACILEGFALSFGNSIVGGAPYTLLNGHDSLHIRRKSYSTMLNYLSTRFVVFFDVQDCRGWLVNGVNALYHILRSSLVEDRTQSTQKRNSLFVLESNQLMEPGDAGAASAARQFLDNKDNLSCKLSLLNIVHQRLEQGRSISNEEEYELLAHRLEQFHDALEILFNYQAQAEELCGRQRRSRAIYEGWDFVDVTRRRDSKPYMMKLPLKGLACIDLLRSARAITLFGRGFGELILPSSEVCCRGWHTLPKMKYYIASSTADVQKLIDEEGELNPESQEPPLLSCEDKILWYSPQPSLNNCGCDTGDLALTGFVQVPWPRRYRSLIKNMEGPSKLEADGAIVFGYNSLVPWHWPEVGDPRPGPRPGLEIEDSDEDSGLGSSIDSSATEQSAMTPAVPMHMLGHRRTFSQVSPIEPSHNTYGDATVHGGHNIFGDSYHQIINNYQQQTTDISMQDSVESKSEWKRGMVDPPTEKKSKRTRLA